MWKFDKKPRSRSFGLFQILGFLKNLKKITFPTLNQLHLAALYTWSTCNVLRLFFFWRIGPVYYHIMQLFEWSWPHWATDNKCPTYKQPTRGVPCSGRTVYAGLQLTQIRNTIHGADVSYSLPRYFRHALGVRFYSASAFFIKVYCQNIACGITISSQLQKQRNSYNCVSCCH